MRIRISPYPTDRQGFVRQCAWCRRVANEQGAFHTTTPALLRGRRVTHGCCQTCQERLIQQFRGPRALPVHSTA